MFKKEEALVDELNSKLQEIENEMDIRVESLVLAIHNYRDNCKLKLDKISKDFLNIRAFDGVREC